MEFNIREIAGNARNNLKEKLLTLSETIWRSPLSRVGSIRLLQDAIVYKADSPSVNLPEIKIDSKHVTCHQNIRLKAVSDYIWQLKTGERIKSLKVCRSGSILLNNKRLLDLDFGCYAGLLESPVKTNIIKYPLVIAPWSHFWGAYYDYVFYVLAKLCRIEETFGKDIWKEARICYPLFKTHFEEEFLAKLGIPPENIIDTSRNWTTAIEADCIIAGNNQESWTPSLHDMLLLKKRFCGDRPAVKEKKRLYIVRAERRKVKNENAVREVLRAYNFDIIEDVTRTVDEQIELFRSASIIIAPHGAALTNLLWCDKGTTIVECFNQSYMPNYYYYMSTVLEHNYRCLVNYSASKPSSHWSNTAEDIHINIADLKKTLAAILQ